MSKFNIFFLLSLFVCNAYAGDLDIAIDGVRDNCSGISGEMADLKKMAGINTAVSATATATATGATVVGIAKSSVDKDLHAILDRVDNPNNTTINPSLDDVMVVYDKYITEYGSIENAQNALNKKSKSLGNWRTGLLGTGTVANAAGTIMANNNKIKKDLKTQIKECRESLNRLDDAMGQARLDGTDTTRAKEIATACSGWKTADISVINHRANGAAISSVIGAGTGMVGTITSAVANSDKTRSGNLDKEKTLNTASNVLAGGTAVAGGVATVFNASQISAVKKIVKIADDCEGSL